MFRGNFHTICPALKVLNGKRAQAMLCYGLLVVFEASRRPIQSLIILVINKSDSRFAVVRFC